MRARTPTGRHPAGVEEARPARSWVATALTGAALLVLVSFHMVAHHFVVEDVGGLRTYRQVLDYISHPAILVIEVVFLVVVTWHAVLGLRSVLYDLVLGARGRTAIDAGMTVLGLSTVGYGVALVAVLASRA
jgi:succinate dehydrogenase hydrophobic anchor subunit